MPLERLILIAQVALIPVLLVAGLLIFGAWRARRRGLLTLLLLFYVPIVTLIVLYRFNVMDAADVASRMPTDMLLWRISQLAIARQGVPEVDALEARIVAGKLTAAHMHRSLAIASGLSTGSSQLVNRVLRAAGSISARDTPQVHGVVQWASAAPPAWTDIESFTLLKSLSEGTAHANGAVVHVAASRTISGLAGLPASSRDSRNDALIALTARDGIDRDLCQRWAASLLALEVRPIGFSQPSEDSAGAAWVSFAPLTSQLRGQSQWSRSLVSTDPPIAVHPDYLEMGTLLPLAHSGADPRILTARLIVESELSGSFLFDLFQQFPSGRPAGFRSSHFDACKARITYDIVVDLRLDPNSTGFLRVVVVEGVPAP